METCPSGVVWALGYDGSAWAYTGGWGGAHFKSSALVQPVQEGCDGTGIPARVGETALLAKQVTQPSYLDPPKKYLKI